MIPDNDDSLFVDALRADLPNAEQQERMRRRLLALGSGLATTTAASVAHASWATTLVAKVSALSWPTALLLSAALATPLVAVPFLFGPASPHHSAAPQPVRSNAGAARARLAPDRLPVPAAAAEPEPEPEPMSAAELASKNASTSTAARGAVSTTGRSPGPAVSVERPAVAAFDAVHEDARSPERARATSTLAAETKLLDRAFAELAAGNQTAAAALIAEHERQFPNGLLRQERERARTRLKQDFKPEVRE